MREVVLILTTVLVIGLWARNGESGLLLIVWFAAKRYKCHKHIILQSMVFEASFGSCLTLAGNVALHVKVVTYFSIRSCGLQTEADQPGHHLPRALPRYRLTCTELCRMYRGWCML